MSYPSVFSLIFIGQLIQLVEAEHGTVLADVFVADVAAPALAQGALHPKLHGGVDLLPGEAQVHESGEGKLNHNGRAADDDGFVPGEGQLLDIVRHEAHMAVPVRFRIVNGKMDAYAAFLAPDRFNLREIHQVRLGAGTVDNIDFSVGLPMGAAVVDYGVQRGKADAAGDKQQVFSHKVRIHREAVAIGTPDGDLLAFFHSVEPVRDTAAFFDGEVQVILRRGGGNGEQGLTHTGHGQHGALTGNVRKGLLPVKAHDPEGFYIRSVGADGGDYA